MSSEAIAVRELRSYRAMRTRTENLQERLNAIDDKLHSIKAGIGDTPVKGGGSEGKYDGFIDLKIKIQGEIDRNKAEMAVIERALDSLSAEDRMVIDCFFFEGHSPNEAKDILRDRLYLEDRQIWRIRKRALHNYAYNSASDMTVI